MRGLQGVILFAVLFLGVHLATAQTFLSQNWFWGMEYESFYYAGTENAAGHTFGQYCYFESGFCFYFIGMGVNCKEGSEYPALLNSDAGSFHITLYCSHKYKEQHVFAFNSFSDIDRIVRGATRISIAVALKDDLFKVSRFSLAGAENAIDNMRSAAEAKMKRKPQNRNRPAEQHL